MDRTEQVDRLQERLHALKALTTDAAATLDRHDLEELSTALDQLQLTEMEIRHQNVELAAARDALESERSRYHDLFDLAPDAYLITNRDGLICEANRASSRLLNVERKFLIGKPLQVFIPAGERSSFRAKVVQAQQATAAIEWRLRVSPRDAPTVDVAAAVAPVTDRGDEQEGLRWSLRDISAQVHDEVRLQDLNAELEQRVADRTAALEAANRAKDALLVRERAARDAAEEASRSKDEFLATISHELRTPLNVVLGWTYRLREHTLDAQQTERAIEIIDRNAHQQLLLVEELLDSARIATGRFELDLETQELGPLLQSAVESLEATAAARNIALTSTLAAGIHVRVDPFRIRQIAWNLLSNALKFTGVRGTVHIELQRAGDQASVEVRDSGIGIADAAIDHIFEPFWTAEQSTRRARSGLGLGLAIVKHLVELHGGTVSAGSDGPGRGSTFTVRFPLVAAPPTAR